KHPRPSSAAAESRARPTRGQAFRRVEKASYPPFVASGGNAASLAGFRPGHPGHRHGDILEDFRRTGKAGERLARRLQRHKAIERAVARPRRRFIDHTTAVPGPFMEKVAGILETGDLLDETFCGSHKYGTFECSLAH